MDAQLSLGVKQGYNTLGDVVTQTVDGRDLNYLWAEYQAAIALQNSERQRLIDLLTFPVTQLLEDVPQFSTAEFEEASEFGVPKGVRTELTVFQMAYSFKWWDVASRYTWKFLAEANVAQVDAIHASILEADNNLIFREVMKTLFNNTNLAATINGQNYTVYKLYNNDGTVPPPYKGVTFDGTHNHYLSTGGSTLDSGDLDDAIEHLRHHGYSLATGTTLFSMFNPAQTQVIRAFRVAQGDTYDFIPASGQPGVLMPIDQQILGAGQVANTFRGFNVIGNYGPLLIIEEEYIPAGYVVTIGSGGQQNLNNPIGIREHVNPALRGLRLVKGPNPDYPLVDSYYQRGFGTGVRQRGAAVVQQVTSNESYAPPTAYA